MKKYYVKRLIFSTLVGRRNLHDNFGVLWKLSRDGFLCIYLRILWARARFPDGTGLALMMPRRASVLVSWVSAWTLQYCEHLMCLGIFTHRIPFHDPAEILTDKASVRKLSSVCTYTQWVVMLSFPRNDGHEEPLPHPDSPISISGPTERLHLSLRLCWFSTSYWPFTLECVWIWRLLEPSALQWCKWGGQGNH